MTSATDTPLELGTRVRFTATLERVAEYLPREAGVHWSQDHRARKTWQRRPRSVFGASLPDEGVIVGARTVYDGVVTYGIEDNPTTFTPETSHRVYLVATTLRGKHLIVSADDVAASPTA